MEPKPKLVFSRKGFDSDSGNGYSPFDPITMKYVVLPIPEDGHVQGVRYRYDELLLRKHYFESVDADNLRDLVHHKHLYFKKTACDLVQKKFAHYDPMLGSCPWLENGPRIAAFGQSEAAAGHLRNERVEKGSVFLFYSRFLPIKDRVHQLEPIAGWSEGVYFLYGWLRVKEVITSEKSYMLPHEVAAAHPHGSDYDFQTRKNNTIYLAADKLFDDEDIPGYGYFPKLSEKLLLSSAMHKKTPSVWKLPSFFNTDTFRPTYLNVEAKIKDRWLPVKEEPEYCYVQTTGRGQEYVTDLKGESSKWLKSLFD